MNTILTSAVFIDPSGDAKGYALDRAARIMRGRGEGGLINVGSNVLANGQLGKRPWQVDIRDSRGDGTVASDYDRYFMKSG